MVIVKYFQFEHLTIASDVKAIKELDKQGRLELPKDWREKYARDGKALLKIENDTIIIKLTEFFDKMDLST